LAVVAIQANPPDEPELRRYSFSQVQMGMPFQITLYATSEAAAQKASQAAFERIAALNAIMSDYDPQSELSRLSDTAGSGRAVAVSEPLWQVLTQSQNLAARSDGAFDITVGPLVRLWRRARRMKELPDAHRLADARAAVGYKSLRLNEEGRTAELLKPGMRLDLGGIAAGFAVDQALAILKKHGVASAMIDASGDIGVSEPPPGASGWRIGIAPLDATAPPSRYLLLKNTAVTTSGGAFQFVEIAGERYSHIVDPRTGLGLTHRSSVTVVAGDCITADSLATAACVLGPKHGMDLVERTPGAAALFVVARDGVAEAIASRRLKDFEVPAGAD
jgi:thiamine biosynthesis lipoprotein